MIRRTALVAAALLVAATVLAVGPASPASAAACTGTTGVTVVVDFNGLGGGVQGACVPDGGGDRATDLFRRAGFSVNDTDSPRNPGYVCQVGGKPAGCGPPDGDAYWGLWTSTGNGSWTYASLGAGSLTVPDGGFVSFAWDDVAGDERPSYTPVRKAPAPSPAPTPSPGPTQQPTRTPSAPAQPTNEPTDEPTTASPSSGASPEATTDATPDAPTTAPPSPSESPTTAPPTPSDAPTTAVPSEAETVLAEPTEPTSGDAAADDDASSLPGWMAPLIIVLLLAIAGVAALLKRRQTP